MAEALYYAGRVYSDLGDYPTTLRYFHDALDRISDDPEDNNILRASIASQTARLMLNLRMYSKALPFAETALEMQSEHRGLNMLNIRQNTHWQHNGAQRKFRGGLKSTILKHSTLLGIQARRIQ